MEIQEIRAFNVPSIFSLREPIVKMQIRLGEYADVPTKDIEGLNDKIIELFPGIKEHKCSTGYVGGFVDRMKEGTYLAHLMEHLCLELQRVLGFDIKYGKARQVKDDLYNVIFACTHPAIGKACGNLIFNTLNDLVNKREVEISSGIEEIRKLTLKYDIGVSTGAIVEEAKRRGIPVSMLNDGEIVRLGYGKYQRSISATLYEGTSSIAVDIACDKQLTKAVLNEAGIPVPHGRTAMYQEEAKKAAADIGYPVVVKPKSGNKGKHVFINIKTEEELISAFNEARTLDGEVIVEEYVEGRDYRLLVVDGKVVAAAERIPAHVTGDGIHTVAQLIELENHKEQRGEDHEKALTKIKIDENMHKKLEKQGTGMSEIPEEGCVIWLKDNANLSTGGIAVDVTEIVHPHNKQAAELAAKTVGLHIAGIDMVIPDIAKPLSNGYGAIVEVNAAPGIRMHLNPAKGKARDVASPILDMIYPEGTPFTIPIVAITGTNGKTTTTRMISRILRKNGYTVGTTTTHGIYINDKCMEEGDTTGPCSARRILNSREIDAAVLETARGGIVRDGLAFQKADVAVFTNLTQDHLGIDEINTMEELLNVKSLVIESVKEDGVCVLNADDPWIMKVKGKAKGRVILFSHDGENPAIREHLDNGGSAVYLKDGFICYGSSGSEQKITAVSGIPATLNGGLKHNISNSMAAVGAALGLGVHSHIIAEALTEFSCDAETNPGRFNVYDMGRFKVVLDYGHNIDGYRVTIDGLKSMGAAGIIGVIGVPGDRRDEDMIDIGYLSGRSFDRIIIKEDRELRGRSPFETANLLLKGVLEGGIRRDMVEIIKDEIEALKQAMKIAGEGDVIVVFFEKMEPLVRLLETYKKDGEVEFYNNPAFIEENLFA